MAIKQMNESRAYVFNDSWAHEKQKDIERAKYWRERGHDFNPDWMTAYQMDQKVKELSFHTRFK